jgi:transporter family-2 protein
MTSTSLLAVLAIAVGGAAIAVQAPLNAALGRSLSSAPAAAAVSFGVGFVVLLVLTLVLGGSGAFARLPAAAPWQLLGGFLGAYYVWAVIWGVPQLGVVTMVAALVLGQMGAAIALDAAGAFGGASHAVTPQRLVAAGLVGAGLILSRL